MPSIRLNDVSINYESLGSGRNVVLVHGLATSKGFWGPDILMPLARRYRVTLLDLRGHGRSSMPDHGYTSEIMARDLARLLETLDIEGADLIGHSFGGIVALHCAVLFPDLVNSVVLADSRVRAFQPVLTARKLSENRKLTKTLSQLGLSVPPDEQESGLWLLEQLARLRQSNKANPTTGDVFVPFGGRNGNGSQAAAQWLSLLRDTTFRTDFASVAGMTKERIAQIKRPVLSLCAENSAAIGSGQALAEVLPNCEMAILSGGGHFFPRTLPTQFLHKVEEFLNSVADRGRREQRRMPVQVPMLVEQRDVDDLPGRTRNVSLSGLALESDAPLRIGDTVNLVADLAKTGPVSLRGEVVRRGAGVGEGSLYGIRLRPAATQQIWTAFCAAGS